MGEYLDDSDKKVTTEAMLGEGGEGAVYDVKGRPKVVAKIMKPAHRTPERDAKIAAMVRRPPADPTAKLGHTSITWPTTALRENGQFAGFLMPKIVNPISILIAYNPQLRADKFENFHWGHSTRTAMNLCRAVAAIHQMGYVIGDVNESNILVTDRALVTLVDTDSFQVTDPLKKKIYRTTVGKGEYLPPELHGLPSVDVDREETQDRFGLAIIIFKLLMESVHPYLSLPDPSDKSGGFPHHEENIARGIFPYAPNSPRKPSPLAPPFTILHPQLQALFQRCFGEGHGQPDRRPTAAEWAAALETAEQDLKVCRKQKHRYASHLAECPWCAREAARNQASASSSTPISTQKPMSSSGLKKPSSPAAQQQGSSTTGTATLPPEARGFSLGGFTLTWLWAFSNRLWLSGLVALVAWLGTVYSLGNRLAGISLDFMSPVSPYLFAAPILLGLTALYLLLFGRRAAWKAKTWASPAAFKSVQRGWAALGLLLWAGFFGLAYLMDFSPVSLLTGALAGGFGRPSVTVVEVTRVAGAEEVPVDGQAAVGAASNVETVGDGAESGAAEVVPASEGERPRVRVLLNAANVRAGPGTTYDIVGQVPRDTLLPVIATNESREWYNVELGDGERGWIGSTTVEAEGSLNNVPVAATIPAP
jgi:serine/threonine protein kinase